MMRSILAALMAAPAILATACGGGGGDSSEEPAAQSEGLGGIIARGRPGEPSQRTAAQATVVNDSAMPATAVIEIIVDRPSMVFHQNATAAGFAVVAGGDVAGVVDMLAAPVPEQARKVMTVALAPGQALTVQLVAFVSSVDQAPIEDWPLVHCEASAVRIYLR